MQLKKLNKENINQLVNVFNSSKTSQVASVTNRSYTEKDFEILKSFELIQIMIDSKKRLVISSYKNSDFILNVITLFDNELQLKKEKIFFKVGSFKKLFFLTPKIISEIQNNRQKFSFYYIYRKLHKNSDFAVVEKSKLIEKNLRLFNQMIFNHQVIQDLVKVK